MQANVFLNVNILMGAPLRYNFKQSSHVHHPYQQVLGISRESIFIRKAKLILWRPLGEDSNNVLMEMMDCFITH